MNPVMLLIIGPRHSGTSILAAHLGAHPEISIVNEGKRDAFKKIYGVPVVGNKLILGDNIDWKKRACKYGHLKNRVYWAKNGVRALFRPYPTSYFNIQDYISWGAKVIYTKRDFGNVISIIQRAEAHGTKILLNQACEYIEWCDEQVKDIPDKFVVEYDRFNKSVHKEAILNDLCDWIGVKYSTKMLDGEDCNWVWLDIRRQENENKK